MKATREQLERQIALATAWRDTIQEKDAEIWRLRLALEEIASDPTGISSYQAEIAKTALRVARIKVEAWMGMQRET